MPRKSRLAKSPKPDATAKAVTLLLTGFDAFAGDKYNPSQLVVETFPDILKSKPRGPSRSAKEIYVHKYVLSTSGVKGWKELKKALDETLESAEGPVYVLMLGMAAMRHHICLERFGMNFKDYRIADNAGNRALDEPVDRRAPQLLRTSLDLPYLKYLMDKAGYPCEVSNHAGTFVCNELYFRALNYAKTKRKVRSVLFMHLPREAEFAKTAKNAKDENTPKDVAHKLKGITKAGKNNQIALLADAVLEVAENMSHDLAANTAPRRK